MYNICDIVTDSIVILTGLHTMCPFPLYFSPTSVTLFRYRAVLLRPKECKYTTYTIKPWRTLYPITATQRHWSITWCSQSGSPRSTGVHPIHSTTQCTRPIQPFLLRHKLGIHTFETAKARPMTWCTKYSLLYNPPSPSPINKITAYTRIILAHRIQPGPPTTAQLGAGFKKCYVGDLLKCHL